MNSDYLAFVGDYPGNTGDYPATIAEWLVGIGLLFRVWGGVPLQWYGWETMARKNRLKYGGNGARLYFPF